MTLSSREDEALLAIVRELLAKSFFGEPDICAIADRIDERIRSIRLLPHLHRLLPSTVIRPVRPEEDVARNDRKTSKVRS